MKSTSFYVPSISCNVCCEKIKTSLSDINGIEDIAVDMTSKMVNVNYDEDLTDSSSIKDKVSSMGYEVE